MELPKLNRSLLKRVLNHIKKDPRRFNMADWVKRSHSAPCGTQACIAGWTVLLKEGNSAQIRQKWIYKTEDDDFHYNYIGDVVESKARTNLGLTEEEGKCLFLTYNSHKGANGIKKAEEKINLLLKDREAFVRKYLPIYYRD